MRIDYVYDPPQNLSTSDQEVVDRVRARRGSRGLIPLDLALLHSPPIADGWNSLLGAIRTKTTIPTDLREIAICRVALLNEAWFEWDAHAPILLEAEDFDEVKAKVVRDPDPRTRGALNEKQWAVLRYTDSMTKNVAVEEGLFDQLKAVGFNDRDIVEITMTVATYNMVSRFLVALDVGEKNGKGPRGPVRAKGE